MNTDSGNIGTIIKRQRVMTPLTLLQLAAISGVSASHLGRIERSERYPSARILHKIAQPLGFAEGEILTLAGYLSPQPPMIAEGDSGYSGRHLDPYVARMLAQEPIETQQAVIGILAILKGIARSFTSGGSQKNT